MTTRKTLGDLALLGMHPTTRHVRLRWRIPHDDDEARPILDAVEKTWKTWTSAQRRLLIAAAEAVAEAERARTRPPLTRGARERFDALAERCTEAAAFALDVVKTFPPPWDGANAAVGEFVRVLVDFASDGLTEAARSDGNVAFWTASGALAALRTHTPRHAGRVSWALVGRLAWLRSGKQSDRLHDDESAVRRFIQTRHRLPRGARKWRDGYSLIARANALVTTAVPSRQRNSGSFEPAIRAFLDRENE